MIPPYQPYIGDFGETLELDCAALILLACDVGVEKMYDRDAWASERCYGSDFDQTMPRPFSTLYNVFSGMRNGATAKKLMLSGRYTPTVATRTMLHALPPRRRSVTVGMRVRV
jgi:hypothetical protein